MNILNTKGTIMDYLIRNHADRYDVGGITADKSLMSELANFFDAITDQTNGDGGTHARINDIDPIMEKVLTEFKTELEPYLNNR